MSLFKTEKQAGLEVHLLNFLQFIFLPMGSKNKCYC